MSTTEALIYMLAHLLLMGIGLAIGIAATALLLAIRAAFAGQNIREAIKPLTDQW